MLVSRRTCIRRSASASEGAATAVCTRLSGTPSIVEYARSAASSTRKPENRLANRAEYSRRRWLTHREIALPRTVSARARCARRRTSSSLRAGPTSTTRNVSGKRSGAHGNVRCHSSGEACGTATTCPRNARCSWSSGRRQPPPARTKQNKLSDVSYRPPDRPSHCTNKRALSRTGSTDDDVLMQTVRRHDPLLQRRQLR